MTTQQPARDAIALKLRAYFTDVVRDRQDRAWTRADELLNAYDQERAEQILNADHSPNEVDGAYMAAALIAPKAAK